MVEIKLKTTYRFNSKSKRQIQPSDKAKTPF